MSDVKWIKITTDIFDDEKILLIESLPDADAIIVIWFKLLCLAGKTNNSGVFILNDIAYTDKMLSTIFRRKESTVQLALETFRKFGMIDILDGVITIPNWGKHQNLDEMERRKEYMRNYMTEYRDKQKGIACKTNGKVNSKVNSKVNVNSAEGEEEKEVDKDLEKESREKAPSTTAKAYGKFKNVFLEDFQLEDLRNEFPDIETTIEKMSSFLEGEQKVYKNYYAQLRLWALRDDPKKPGKTKTPPKPSEPIDTYDFIPITEMED